MRPERIETDQQTFLARERESGMFGVRLRRRRPMEDDGPATVGIELVLSALTI